MVGWSTNRKSPRSSVPERLAVALPPAPMFATRWKDRPPSVLSATGTTFSTWYR